MVQDSFNIGEATLYEFQMSFVQAVASRRRITEVLLQRNGAFRISSRAT